MEQIKNDKFKLIRGGQADKPVVSRDDKLASIYSDIARQNELGREEALDLVKRMKKERMVDIKSSVARQCSRVLSDEEANFIGDRYLGLASNNVQAIKELHEKFPELIDYFNNLLAEFKQLQRDKEK